MDAPRHPGHRIISRKKIRLFLESHSKLDPASALALDRWYRIARRATWANFADVRRDFSAADIVGPLTVFDVGGNKVRIIARILYGPRIHLLLQVLTHPEYDKGDWKS